MNLLVFMVFFLAFLFQTHESDQFSMKSISFRAQRVKDDENPKLKISD